MTIRIWNDGNPIRIVETTSNDHSLHIAWNPCHFAFQITYIASPFKRQSNPNHSVILKRTANHLQNSLFHHSLPVNHIQIPIPSQLPHNPNTLKSSSLHILLVPTIPFQSRIPPFPTPLPTLLFPIPQNHHKHPNPTPTHPNHHPSPHSTHNHSPHPLQFLGPLPLPNSSVAKIWHFQNLDIFDRRLFLDRQTVTYWHFSYLFKETVMSN